MAVFAVAMVFAAGLALDGGRRINGLAQARDLADNAARVGAQQVDPDTYRATGSPDLDPTAAANEAAAYLAATGNPGAGQVDVTGTTITVTVTITVPTLILPGPYTVTATQTASAEASVTGGP
jgi:hypothetical protein